MFTHVIKELYDFSASIDDEAVSLALNQVIQRQETFPARLLDLFKPVEESEMEEEDEI